MRCALYTRVSTDKQEIENQLAQLRAYCQTAGHTIAHEFIDDGFSGKTSKRPALQRMLAYAHQRKFDILIFWSLDRLTREGALAALQHLQRLEAAGVAWRSHTEPYFDSCGPFKDAVIAIIGTVAKMERIRIGERTKAGLARVRAAGTVIGRPPSPRRADIVRLKAADPSLSIRALATRLHVSKATVERTLRGSR